MTRWTDEAREEVFRLWREGYSASRIAKMVPGGRTRNAVIGVVFRGGLANTRQRPSPPQRVKAGLALPNRGPTVKRNRPSANGAAERLKANARATPQPAGVFLLSPANRTSEPGAPKGAADASAFSPLPGQEPVPFMARRWSQCAWPVSDAEGPEMPVCGAEVPDREGQHFCAFHREAARNKRARSYTPAQFVRAMRPYAA